MSTVDSIFYMVFILFVIFESTSLNYANPCQNWTFVLSSLLPLRSVGRSNFYKYLHNLVMLIQKRHKSYINVITIYIYNVYFYYSFYAMSLCFSCTSFLNVVYK